MNLIDCESCGIVLNKDRLFFYVMELESGGYDPETAGYNDYTGLTEAKVVCPCCGEDIFEGGRG